MKRTTFMAIIFLMATAPVCGGWTVTGVGSSGEWQGRAGLTGDRGGQVGLIGAIHEDLLGGDEELYSAGVYGLHTVAQGAAFPVGKLVPFGLLDGVMPETIPCDVYLLGTARVLESHGHGLDPIASAGVGLRFNFLIVEYQWTPSESVWNEFPAVADQHAVFIGACWATP